MRGRDPALRGDVLVRQPGGDELGDLELHRGQLDQGGRVAFAGGLAGGPELLGRRGRRGRRRAGPGRSPGRRAGAVGRRPAVGDGAATRRRPAGCGPRSEGRPARAWCEKRVLEQGLRLHLGPPVIARPKATVARAQGRPVASAKPARSSTDARARSGSSARTAASMRLRGGHPGDDGEPEPRGAGAGRRRCRHVAAARVALGPAGEVVHRVGQDAQRMPSAVTLLEVVAGGSS